MEKETSSNQLIKPASIFFGDKQTRTYLGVFALVFLLVTLKTYYSLALKDTDLHDEVRFLDSWAISFDEENYTVEETYLLSHEESETLTIEIQKSTVPDNYAIAMFLVQISYEETNQVIGGDPCDTVHGNIIVTSLNAQWEDDNNTLTDSSNSCQTIFLQLLAYPGYDGLGYEVEAHNQVLALEPWAEEEYGLGTFEVEVKLQVEQSQIPSQDNDDDETIYVTVETVFFKAIAEKLS